MVGADGGRDSQPPTFEVMGEVVMLTTNTSGTVKAIRVLLPNELYEKVKKQCPDHGMISQLIRALLEKHLRGLEC